mgnify:CR=1 FL=1
MLTNLKLLLSITSNDYDSLLNLLITMAKDLAKLTLYPFEEDLTEIVLSHTYDYWVVMAAKEMYQNLGNENIRSYSENGLSISYKDMTNGLSMDLLNQLVPKVGIPK